MDEEAKTWAQRFDAVLEILDRRGLSFGLVVLAVVWAVLSYTGILRSPFRDYVTKADAFMDRHEKDEREVRRILEEQSDLMRREFFLQLTLCRNASKTLQEIKNCDAVLSLPGIFAFTDPTKNQQQVR